MPRRLAAELNLPWHEGLDRVPDEELGRHLRNGITLARRQLAERLEREGRMDVHEALEQAGRAEPVIRVMVAVVVDDET